MATMVEMPGEAMPADGDYPTGEEDEDGDVKLSLAEEELLADFTYEELKEAFSMLFDADGEGTISVATFRVILKEIDETFSDEELDGICSDMDPPSIDFNEFVKIMS